MNSPRFTFCIPNLNKIRYLPACIQSVLDQDCRDWRCVFVDGYSTDGSWEYMQQFGSDHRFLLLRGQQQGMYADWNECLKYVETDYFYFLTSDDTCFSQLVSTTMAALDSYPNVDVCHFQFAFINNNGSIINPPEEIVQNYLDLYCDVNKYAHLRSGLCEFMMHFVYRALYITITSLVFRRNLIPKMKGFTTTYGILGDYDWTMRLGLFTDVLYIPHLLATWRRYEEQASYDLSTPQIAKNFLDIAKNNLDFFIKTDRGQSLKKQINTRQVLSYISDTYISSLYKEFTFSKRFSSLMKPLDLSFQSALFFSLRKSIRRLSDNKLFTYFPKKAFAYQLIDTYELPWPPIKVDMNKINDTGMQVY